MSQTGNKNLWARFQRHYTEFPALGLALDLSRMNFTEDFLEQIRPRLDKAFNAMDELEAGAIANPDENRMVGHYWLRNSTLAPTGDITAAIDQAMADIKAFAAKVHNGEIQGAEGPVRKLFDNRHWWLGAWPAVRCTRPYATRKGQDDPLVHRQHRPR